MKWLLVLFLPSLALGAEFSSMTVRDGLYSSSAGVVGMNHRMVQVESGSQFYTDVGIDPWNDPHIFQTFEHYGGDISTQWICGNSGDGYAVITAKTQGSASTQQASKLFSAGTGTNYNWVPGVPVRNSAGLIVSKSSETIIYSETAPIDIITEGVSRPIKLWPNLTNSFEASQNGVIVTGYLKITEKTLAELRAFNGSKNVIFACSDCVQDSVCISTGTGYGAFARMTSKITPCQ